MNWQYPAKLLLFGEYTVLSGSSGIAVPLKLFGSRWQQADTNTDIHRRFWDIAHALKEIELSAPIKTAQLESDQKNGWVLQSGIPYGQGLGSSGNLCAAFYHRFFVEDRTAWNSNIKNDLIRLENYFHGHSSGLDPCCIFSAKPVLMKPAGIERWEKPLDLSEFSLFLLDSGTDRKTKSLIQAYKDHLKDPKFLKAVKAIEEKNEACIKWLLKREPRVLFKYFAKLSKLQFQHWDFLIPESIQSVWQQGIQSRDFYLKICGAGGGGFFMGMALNDDSMPPGALKIN